MSLTEQIADLEKQLAELKKQAHEQSFLDKSGDFKLVVYDDNNEPHKEFNTFRDLFNFWMSKCKKNDLILLQYIKDGNLASFEASSEQQFEKIVEVISQLDGFYLVRIDFAIWNTRTDRLKFCTYFDHPLLKQWANIEDNKHSVTEQQYWKMVEQSKKFRLFENNGE